MLQNYNVDISEFIKFTNGGIKVADFTQVRDAIITRYKSVYGSDIDLSTASADGVFVNDLALIINNILQSYKTLYANLDVNSATGVYLDNLCALSNVVRKPATQSIASILVTNISSSEIQLDSPTFVDKAGTEWLYDGTLILAPKDSAGSSQSIQVKCSEYGPIEAPAGWIDKTLENTNTNVVQNEDAIVGENVESDSNLRARRAQSTGADGITVLESLVGSLLGLSGIKDVKVYNNNSSEAQSNLAKDGTTMSPHSIYVVLRYLEGITIADSEIGSIIYEKLTPGIDTNEAGVEKKRSFDYVPSISGQQIELFKHTVYWKQAISVHPKIDITLNTFEYFNDKEAKEIGQALIDYLNNLQLSTDLTTQNITVEAAYADPLFLGRPTYTITSVAITGATNGTFKNADTYYNYTSATYDSNTKILTLD